MSVRPICAVDVETDGVHPGRQAWEVAIIRRDGRGERDYQFFLDVDLSTADPMGLKIGGFYDRHPVGRWLAGHDVKSPEFPDEPGPIGVRSGMMVPGRLMEPPLFTAGPLAPTWTSPTAAVAAQIAKLTHGATLVGAVPSFDAETFAALLRRHSLTPAWHHRICCVESMTAGHLRLLDVGGLSDCADALGVEHPDAHTALGDARTALAIWDTIVGGTK